MQAEINALQRRGKVRHDAVNVQVLPRCPFDGAGMAGDKKGGHRRMLGPTAGLPLAGKLAGAV